MVTMKFSAPPTLPPGRYPATLLGIDEGDGKFGPYLDWEFSVVDPDGQDKAISRRTSTKSGNGSIARTLIESLLGRSVKLDEEVDLDGLAGHACTLEIETNANGYDSVSNAFPAGTAVAVDVDDLDEVAF